MTYTAKYRQLTAQRTYARAVARGGIAALLAPYTVVRRVPVVPLQRRRVVRSEVTA